MRQAQTNITNGKLSCISIDLFVQPFYSHNAMCQPANQEKNGVQYDVQGCFNMQSGESNQGPFWLLDNLLLSSNCLLMTNHTEAFLKQTNKQNWGTKKIKKSVATTLWSVFFHSVGFSMHLPLTSIQLSPQPSPKAIFSDVMTLCFRFLGITKIIFHAHTFQYTHQMMKGWTDGQKGTCAQQNALISHQITIAVTASWKTQSDITIRITYWWWLKDDSDSSHYTAAWCWFIKWVLTTTGQRETNINWHHQALTCIMSVMANICPVLMRSTKSFPIESVKCQSRIHWCLSSVAAAMSLL